MNMPTIIENIMFSPCGMNCMVCYVHLKKKKPCEGCLSDDINKPERCKICKIKTCAQEKGITYCCWCKEFPCKVINNLEKSYLKRYRVSLIDNSISVKNKGIEYFLQKEIEKWNCSECNGIISLHDNECSECGRSFISQS
jgi:hypothetical protein